MMRDMKWRVLMWSAAAAGAVIAVGLGAYVAVAGVDKAAGPAGVIAAFCELVAVTLAVTGWARQRQTPAQGEPGARTEPPGTPGVVHIREGKGVQIGDHNEQTNNFG
ncbi:hypothetical protein ACIBQ1_39365 [Nonomuraea sp. NPDC050153]|uniref:hypothetical protein n=1 Tax=Nonomuraea sp. NPDC050153 TaxID=3364359 RepID=UPI0037AEAECD